MPIEWFAIHIPLQVRIAAQNSWYGVVVVLVYVALTGFLLSRTISEFQQLDRRKQLLLALLTVSAILFSHMVVLRVPAYLGSASSLIPPALLAFLPLIICGLWLGHGPAILIGLVTGASWMLFASGRITQPFEVALVAATNSFMIRQRYRGQVGNVLRQPFAAILVSAMIVGWPLSLFSIIAAGGGARLENLETALQALGPMALAFSLIAAVSGILAQGLTIWRPEKVTWLIPAPWERHVGQRMLYTLVPIGSVAIIILMGALFLSSYQAATQFIIDQLSRDASNVRENVSFFMQFGRSSIQGFAQNLALVGAGNASEISNLNLMYQEPPFFQQVIFVDSQGTPSVIYSIGNLNEPALSSEEAALVEATLSRKVSGEVVTYSGTDSDAQMSFIAPVASGIGTEKNGAIIGRTRLSENPILRPSIDILKSGLLDSGSGFIVDKEDRILIDPGDAWANSAFALDDAHIIPANRDIGQVIRGKTPDGTRELIVRLPSYEAPDWSIIVATPQRIVLLLAAQIALPILGLLIVIAGASLPLIAAFMGRIANRLNLLLEGIETLTAANFSEPILLAGEDEIGRLGRAFERMRIDLKNRLDEQERLLRVSRSVSSSLELFRAVPPILSSALEVANAIGVRLVLQKGTRDVSESYAAGEAAAIIAPLDAQLMELVERQGTVVVSQLWRASNSLDMTALPPRIQSLVAIPLRSETSFLGIFWLAYDHEHMFEQAEMTFLSTLAGQAAIAIANARLFAEVEAERAKLRAVLASTTDALIVADNSGRIILMNPAAEQFLGVRVEDAMLQPVGEIIEVPELAALLTDLQQPVSVIELPGQQGKAVLANSSTIVGADGAITGRAALMRDITVLRELDNIKTVFLRMVSHDLRSPLTYMRGYLSLLPMIGELNEPQIEAVEKVNNGIDSISELTERLLNLSRLQFGDQAELEFSMVDIEALLHEIAMQQGTLSPDRTITLDITSQPQLPLVAADEMLYRQAITNLVNNALKYTPEGDSIVVRAFQLDNEEHPQIRVSVTDHGIGIRQEDQEKLFEAFFRVPQREGEPVRPRGNGLGLALVKAIAAAHGGTVGVESTFGKGSTFHLTMPIRGLDDL